MNINITADFGRDYWHFAIGAWQITLSSRTWADDTLGSWDAGAVAYEYESSGERSIRLPFMAAFWGRA